MGCEISQAQTQVHCMVPLRCSSWSSPTHEDDTWNAGRLGLVGGGGGGVKK